MFTLYLRPAFATWRLTHLLLGAAMMLTGYSILIVDNRAFDTFQIPALRIYLFVLFGISTAAFIWVAVVSRYLDAKREYEIVDVTRHPEAHAVEIRACPVGRRLAYHAGQFAGVDLLDDRLQINRDFESHPFSITTAPEEEEIGLVIEATERIQRIAGADGSRRPDPRSPTGACRTPDQAAGSSSGSAAASESLPSCRWRPSTPVIPSATASTRSRWSPRSTTASRRSTGTGFATTMASAHRRST